MLTQRQKKVLQAIVRQYTSTGQPVGSKHLAEKLPFKVSSATVRNEMAILEDNDLILKEHSSSGRVPSKQGYRYYVDNLLDPQAVTDNDLVVIQNSLGTGFQKIDEIISHSADILSNLTSYTAFTLKPEQESVRLSGFRVVPLGNHKVIAILVTDSGEVESQSFTLPRDIDTDAMQAVIRMINDQLVGLTLSEVVKRLKDDIPLQVVHYMHSPDGFLDIFDNVLSQAARERFFVGGRLNLLDFASTNDPHTIQALYGLLDRNDNLSNLLDPTLSSESEVNVKIGQEISKNKLLDDYSLITASYNVEQYGKGIIAVLGPTRMPYSRTIGIVNAFRQELAKRLLDFYRHYYDS
ncbi:heat-inducible transcriptional repressor HrcA [Limosilactobacillus walteri]|uniref:Heat-inducible transcription repressor HrcA n=1 Tax=Limosilactobacillus walteri TaxID=2268022 RepID=A0ABR8PA26_9LACO|nr:heat-inducible transcriptional repressor HrcA [Limosilactobacillus walteri]MBD5807556.1 heat-inducible transcriptional repressor HrcA [Limosilactobacillus walteri]